MHLSQRLTRLRAPSAEGPDGALYPDWRTPEEQWSKADYWCSFQPVGSREDLVAQQRTETTHIARVEPGADIIETDRVRYKGMVHEVDGEPLDWTDESYGDQRHWKVFCKRIEGG